MTSPLERITAMQSCMPRYYLVLQRKSLATSKVARDLNARKYLISSRRGNEMRTTRSAETTTTSTLHHTATTESHSAIHNFAEMGRTDRDDRPQIKLS